MSPSASLRDTAVVLVGPSLNAVSGVSTHLQQLLGSELATDVHLLHFQVGSEGHQESRVLRLWRYLSSPFALAVFLVRKKARLVHLNTSLNIKAYWRDLTYLYVARLLHRKVVFQVHGGALPQDFFPDSSLAQRLLCRVLLAADAVVLLGAAELAAYQQFVPRAHTLVIPNAIDPAALWSKRVAPAAHSALRLVYVGRVMAEKGVLDVIEAVRLLRERKVDVMLTVAGSGPHLTTAQKAVATSKLEDRVQFLGPVFGPAKNQLWRSSHVFAFPTYHTERLPYALLEGMAAGTVPIVCAAGAIADVVEEGVHGYFVPPRNPGALANRIEQLHANPAALMQLSRACQSRIQERYTVARLAREFQALYQQLATPGLSLAQRSTLNAHGTATR